MVNCNIVPGRHRIIAAGVAISMLLSVSWADQTIRNLKRPIQVQLETPVQSGNTTIGQPFAAKLAEPVHYKNLTLPAGTEFKGHVAKFGHSKHFGRPGYVVLQTDEATLPSGQTMAFDPAKYKPTQRALRDPSSETFFQSVGIQSLYTTCSLGVTVPLHYAGGVDWLPLLAVGEGVRIAAGALFGLVRPKFRNEPVPRKIALGALDGSGIPRVVNFIGTYPEADYHPGDSIKLYLNPRGLGDLFQSGKAAIRPKPVSYSVADRQAAF